MAVENLSANPGYFEELTSHLLAHAVRTDGPFTLRSGAISSWYLDARQTTFSGEGARLVGRVMLDHIDADVEAVGGLTLGADPVGLATAMAASESGRPLAAFSIRKAPKDHGTGGRLVGPVGPGTLVAIVEDTTSTGGAMVEAIVAARSEGLEIVHAVALIDRSGGAAESLLAEHNVRYTAIIKPSDLGVE